MIAPVGGSIELNVGLGQHCLHRKRIAIVGERRVRERFASGQPSAVDITNNGAVLWGEQTVLLVNVKFG